ncbi:UNVERIFIED_CONTAM: hypothetical protein Sradi_5255600 [Sesamum radiatum]|uniref:Endonuclease/exonuclease/phosphatase domain-containing protein n=1 Tax=Sesamum radiatum TaxID=300843 RepID=A0AAW2LP40_SESRA
MQGFGGGLKKERWWLSPLWNKDTFADLVSFSASHIEVRVQLETGDDYWRFTGFCGAPESSNQSFSWTLLRHLSRIFTLPWVYGGDFNAIISDEKDGVLPTPQWQLRSFREALDDNMLFDVGFMGFPFTWSNNRETPHTVWKLLDRVYVNVAWNSKWPDSKVTHLQCIYSDDAQIFFEWRQCHNSSKPQNKPIRFLAMRIKSETCVFELWDCLDGVNPDSVIQVDGPTITALAKLYWDLEMDNKHT